MNSGILGTKKASPNRSSNMLKCSAIALIWKGPHVFIHSFLISSSCIGLLETRDFFVVCSVFCLWLYSSPLDGLRLGRPILTLK